MADVQNRALRTRAFWEPIACSLFWMATGAAALAYYLEVQQPGISTDRLSDRVRFIWWGLFLFWCLMKSRPNRDTKEPTPVRSGTGVVLACGLSAAFFLNLDASGPSGFILPAAVLLATTAAATLVYRFASKHGDTIGEARFQTVPKDHAD